MREICIESEFVYLIIVMVILKLAIWGRLDTGQNTMEIPFLSDEDLYVCQHNFERCLKFLVVE